MYTEEQIRDKIIDIINTAVEENNNEDTLTKYRSPVIGFASAEDPLYAQASEIIGYEVMHPKEILPEAKTVAAFFIPFDFSLLKFAKIRHPNNNGEWDLGYYELNLFISKLLVTLRNELRAMGLKAETQPVTENFDPIELTTKWPHKTSAYIAGLGTFGINRLLITPMGCGGRLGSVIISEEITPSKRPEHENCLYKEEGKCGMCVENCPRKALMFNSFLRFKCNSRNHRRENSSFFNRGCASCSSGPCSFYPVPKVEGHDVWVGRTHCRDLSIEI